MTSKRNGPRGTGPAPSSTTEETPISGAPEAYSPTPFDPTILVFKYAPWITRDMQGIYFGMSDVEYHLDPVVGGSVSSSLLRKMVPPKGTAKHGLYYLTAEREEHGYFDLGSAVHTGLLCTGKTVTLVEGKSWQSNAALAARQAAYDKGEVPLLQKEIELADAMVAAVLDDDDCAALFAPGSGTAELVVIWEDPETGVMCRAKLDWVPNYATKMKVVDVKTKAGNADPGSVSTVIEQHGYHQQLAFYISGIEQLIALGLLPPVDSIEAFLVIVGKNAPHVPYARPMDEESIEIGRVQIRKALHVYRDAMETGTWPGYTDPNATGLPYWAKSRFQHQHVFEHIYDVPEDSW
jgi:hypothetical protein